MNREDLINDGAMDFDVILRDDRIHKFRFMASSRIDGSVRATCSCINWGRIRKYNETRSDEGHGTVFYHCVNAFNAVLQGLCRTWETVYGMPLHTRNRLTAKANAAFFEARGRLLDLPYDPLEAAVPPARHLCASELCIEEATVEVLIAEDSQFLCLTHAKIVVLDNMGNGREIEIGYLT